MKTYRKYLILRDRSVRTSTNGSMLQRTINIYALLSEEEKLDASIFTSFIHSQLLNIRTNVQTVTSMYQLADRLRLCGFGNMDTRLRSRCGPERTIVGQKMVIDGRSYATRNPVLINHIGRSPEQPWRITWLNTSTKVSTKGK